MDGDLVLLIDECLGTHENMLAERMKSNRHSAMLELRPLSELFRSLIQFLFIDTSFDTHFRWAWESAELQQRLKHLFRRAQPEGILLHSQSIQEISDPQIQEHKAEFTRCA